MVLSRMSGREMEFRVGHTPNLGSYSHNLGAKGSLFLPAQETCAVRPEPLLLVRISASGGLIPRMGAINCCLKHPLARDTPVCLLAVLGEQHPGKTSLLNCLLQGLPGQVRAGLGEGLRPDWGTPHGFGRGMGVRCIH